MKIKTRYVGLSLITGLIFSGVSALDVSARQPEIGTSSKPSFCNQLRGETFERTELFFGLSKPNNVQVTNEEFQSFVDSVVTPLFPDGLTLLTARGQFKNSSGEVIVERSRLLILLYPFSSDSNAKVEQIRTAYKDAFQQESVLRVDEQSCVSF
ncbi:MAG: DUF3574 domain-containing protein [Phormidesmis sp. CAN_BIN36]|nr:DUF3574 domain-containing protein [Phormidesmis sp. CAN_BIN36]